MKIEYITTSFFTEKGKLFSPRIIEHAKVNRILHIVYDPMDQHIVYTKVESWMATLARRDSSFCWLIHMLLPKSFEYHGGFSSSVLGGKSCIRNSRYYPGYVVINFTVIAPNVTRLHRYIS